MKKVLSFVLVLAMILGCTAMAFADVKVVTVSKDNTVVPFDDAKDNGMMTILRDIGAVAGVGDNKVNLEGNLTRAEAATIVVRALGLEELGKIPTKTQFKDVPADAWYSGYVAVAAAQGIVDGRSKTEFDPEANLTVDEALALIIKTLGYRAEHLAGVWPANFRNVARTLGLLSGITAGSVDATREDYFTILFHALDLNQVTWTESNSGYYAGGGTQINSNGINLSYFLGATLYEQITGLAEHVASRYGFTSEAKVLTSADKFANGFDASEFYGKSVVLLTKAERDGTPKNIGIWELDTTTLTGKFSLKRGDKNNFDKFVAADGTEYKLTGGALATMPGLNVAVFRNGVSVGAVDLTLSDATEYELAVTLSKDKKTITEFTSFSYWAVDGVAVVNETQAALLADLDVVKLNKVGNKLANLSFKTTKAAVNSTKEVYLAGSVVVEGDVDALEDIEEEDVVELYADSQSKIVKAVVTRDKVVGTVSKETATYYNVSGTKYDKAAKTVTAYGFTAWPTIVDATSEYAFYLNAAGKVVKAELTKEKAVKNYSYAFVTGFKTVVADQGTKTKENVTYASIWLTTPGEEEALYDTQKCITGDAVSTADTLYNTTDFAGKKYALVKVNVVDGTLKSVTNVTVVNPAVLTVAASGVVSGAKITADTKIYKVLSDGAAELKKPANYKELAFDDIKGRTFSGSTFAYVEGENKTVDVIVIKAAAGSLTGDQTVITGAAFQSAYYNNETEKYDVTFLTFDGDVTFALKADKYDDYTFTTLSFGSISLNAGEFADFAVYSGATKTFTGRATVEAIVFDGERLDNELTEDHLYVAEDAPVWFYDATVRAPKFVEADFDEAIGDELAANLSLIDFNGDGEYDFIAVFAGAASL